MSTEREPRGDQSFDYYGAITQAAQTAIEQEGGWVEGPGYDGTYKVVWPLETIVQSSGRILPSGAEIDSMICLPSGIIIEYVDHNPSDPFNPDDILRLEGEQGEEV